MERNRYYQSAHWRSLKHATHQRDGWKCTVIGCGSSAELVCDHIQTRPNVDRPTSADTLANTRTLCGFHDRQIKESSTGKRRREGQATVVGCRPDGTPLDPNHPWHRRAR
ncbi:HNH endonuclease [Rhizobium leguminosarum]|uniref:HNH endonuclease n=1 Tax=Rhizobium leguminosarum TaxID=384 RepID=UPI001031DFC9|nr:HNH endonuclease [Rhizobium leguminosarum]TAX10752.1 HNH endonuclease [Rhizobium leguminosarum]